MKVELVLRRFYYIFLKTWWQKSKKIMFNQSQIYVYYVVWKDYFFQSRVYNSNVQWQCLHKTKGGRVLIVKENKIRLNQEKMKQISETTEINTIQLQYHKIMWLWVDGWLTEPTLQFINSLCIIGIYGPISWFKVI